MPIILYKDAASNDQERLIRNNYMNRSEERKALEKYILFRTKDTAVCALKNAETGTEYFAETSESRLPARKKQKCWSLSRGGNPVLEHADISEIAEAMLKEGNSAYYTDYTPDEKRMMKRKAILSAVGFGVLIITLVLLMTAVWLIISRYRVYITRDLYPKSLGDYRVFDLTTIIFTALSGLGLLSGLTLVIKNRP
ncbi:MAG: hypothetical protein IKR59_08485 [Lachnospiraceae bacterium]|nr:hypothetical protein [Lachnospiraceae bacterium]